MTLAFEKWQALGNDYVIVEAANLPFELTPARVRRLCDHHLGAGSDGVLLLSEPDEEGFVARLPTERLRTAGENPDAVDFLWLLRCGWHAQSHEQSA